MDTNRPEANFTFEMNQVRDFLTSTKYRGSEFFYCRGMRFFVQLRRDNFDGFSGLSVFLSRYNPSDDYFYSMETNFELRLINWLGKEDLVQTFNYLFTSDTAQGYGYKNLILIDELVNPFNGWVQNDALRLRVNLKCESFYLTSK